MQTTYFSGYAMSHFPTAAAAMEFIANNEGLRLIEADVYGAHWVTWSFK